MQAAVTPVLSTELALVVMRTSVGSGLIYFILRDWVTALLWPTHWEGVPLNLRNLAEMSLAGTVGGAAASTVPLTVVAAVITLATRW